MLDINKYLKDVNQQNMDTLWGWRIGNNHLSRKWME